MAQLVLILAKSGTGKSSSMRNLKKDEAAVVLCSGKELPFKHDLQTMVPKTYADINNVIAVSKKPIIVIDDINYMMSFEEISRVNEVGYAKFTQMASNMLGIFRNILNKDSDQVFYIMAHQDEDEDGQIRMKTTGKMLSEKVVLEGLVNVVITTEVSDGDFLFRVKTDGLGVKTPIGMFDTPTIPNDLKLVDSAIREFYDIKPEVKKKETK